MATKTVPACPDSDTLGACAKLFFELDGHASAIKGLMADAIEAIGATDEPDAYLLGKLTNLAASVQSITMLMGGVAGLGSALAKGESCHSQHAWLLSPAAVDSVEGVLKARKGAA